MSAAVKAIFRRGNPAMVGKPTPGARMSAPDDWWPLVRAGAGITPDTQVLPSAVFEAFVESLSTTGFGPGLNFYGNNEAHERYVATAVNGSRLDMPVLFIHAAYDLSCTTVTSRLPGAMITMCTDLQEEVVNAGHWVQQERGAEVNASLLGWIESRVAEASATSRTSTRRA